MFVNAYKLIFGAMRKHSVKRIIGLATPSVTAAEDKGSLAASIGIRVIRTIANSAYTEIVGIGELFTSTDDIDWTLARVGNLGNDDTSVGAFYIGEKGWSMNTSRAGAARWYVKELGRDEQEYLHKKPALANLKK
jgi:hypothetical protein